MDDGSTNVKLAKMQDGKVKTHVSQNAFSGDWARCALFSALFLCLLKN
ncbi:plasmid segregation protein ParM domain-containing protein [Photorhabdus hainanensis]